MNPTVLSQWQFAITTVYHFFFVPLTLGLAVLTAIMETLYVSSGKEVHKRMTKFWGRLFLINFAMGVVTGIVLEFQFGMNWAEYSRLVGNIFGAPLAIEALLAFFLESTFIGVWIFGWERLPKKLHALTIWLVAIGVNLSALWILVANSWMQHPVGYSIENGVAVMTSFGALLANPYVWGQFPHVIFSGLTTASFFVLGISAYHLFRKNETDLFQRSFKLAGIVGVVAVLGVIGVGHAQTQALFKLQPMKIAAAEALIDTQPNAGLSLFSSVNQETLEENFAIRIPGLLSFLAYNRFDGTVTGVRDLQAQYSEMYGEGNYIPNILVSYWSFRVMVGVGFLMLGLAAYVLYQAFIRKRPLPGIIGRVFPLVLFLPYLANTTGWLLTEMGRQPWVVYGVLKTADAGSVSVTGGMVLTSLIGFSLVYGLLMVVDVYLLSRYAKAGPVEELPAAETAVENHQGA